MNLRSVGSQVTGAVPLSVVITLMVLPSYAQVRSGAQTNSASHVSAEMTKGKLNPADSKPGDIVAIKLKDDVRSNGEVILKKGATITGVVRNVKRAETKAGSKGTDQSMMEIEWLVPSVQGHAVQSVSVALQSVTQVNPVYRHEQGESIVDDHGLAAGGTSAVAARPVRASGGLLGSAGGSVGAATGEVAPSTATLASATSSTSAASTGRSNVALLSMPSVVAVDQQTSSAIESTLGTSSSGQLFRVGHGELISAGGSKQSVDLYSHLGNDTVITAPGKNFEISSGAQMQMLVGVNRK